MCRCFPNFSEQQGSAAAPSISKRTRVLFRSHCRRSWTLPIITSSLKGRKDLSPPVCIPSMNSVCTKWSCEQQQCQAQAFRARESGLQQSWDWFFNHAINLPPQSCISFVWLNFESPKHATCIFNVLFFSWIGRRKIGKKNYTGTCKLPLIFQELQWNLQRISKNLELPCGCELVHWLIFNYIMLILKGS